MHFASGWLRLPRLPLLWKLVMHYEDALKRHALKVLRMPAAMKSWVLLLTAMALPASTSAHGGDSLITRAQKQKSNAPPPRTVRHRARVLAAAAASPVHTRNDRWE